MNLRLTLIPSHNLVVSGSTGFIGRTILSQFGDQVVRIESLDQIPDGFVLIHLSAVVSGDVEKLLRTNFDIDMAATLVASARLGGIVYASSNNVYPLHAQDGVVYSMGAATPYAASKRIGECLIQSQARCPWWIARIGDVFGCGQTHGNFFRAVEKSIKSSEPIRLLGAGGKVRSYVYAPDLARALLNMADKLRTREIRSEISNLCYSDPLTLAEIVNQLAEIASLPVELVGIPDDASAADFRTMTPGPLHGFQWRWAMRSALADYVAALKNKVNAI